MQKFCKGGGGRTWGILKRGGTAASSVRGSTGRQRCLAILRGARLTQGGQVTQGGA